MRFFRILAGLLSLLCLIPPLVLLVAVMLGRWAGCEPDPDAPHVCQVLGGDYGDILYALAHFGDHTDAALSILAALLVSWLVVEIVRAMGRPRKRPVPQTPASSRKRERGS